MPAEGSRLIDSTYVNRPFTSMPDFHSHEHLEMFFCLSDGITCLIGDEIHTVNRFDTVLFDRSTLHRTIIPEGMRYERYVVSFSQADLTRLVPDAAPLCRLFRARKGHCLIHLENDPERDYLMDRIRRLHESAQADGDVLLQLGILLEILVFLRRREGGAANPPQDRQLQRIQPVLSYLGEHFSEKILLDDLCARFYMSRSRLTQSFRAATGLTIGEYLLQLRLSHARTLLTGGTEVERTALLCGFGSAANFIRCFRAHMGISPKQYALKNG